MITFEPTTKYWNKHKDETNEKEEQENNTI
jgi:hypothetical protein